MIGRPGFYRTFSTVKLYCSFKCLVKSSKIFVEYNDLRGK